MGLKEIPRFIGSKMQSSPATPPLHTHFSICEIKMHLTVDAVSEVNWQLFLSWWSIQ